MTRSFRTCLSQLKFANFMPEGKVHHFLDHLGGAVQKAEDAAILAHKIGLYPGSYLEEWLSRFSMSSACILSGT